MWVIHLILVNLTIFVFGTSIMIILPMLKGFLDILIKPPIINSFDLTQQNNFNKIKKYDQIVDDIDKNESNAKVKFENHKKDIQKNKGINSDKEIRKWRSSNDYCNSTWNNSLKKFHKLSNNQKKQLKNLIELNNLICDKYLNINNLEINEKRKQIDHHINILLSKYMEIKSKEVAYKDKLLLIDISICEAFILMWQYEIPGKAINNLRTLELNKFI